MSLDNEQYRQLFIEEAKEHIDTITKSMLILEKEPENKEVVNMLFRSAHTLKGSSGMMGFKDFQELTHAMEDVFDDMRKGNKPTSNLISALLECVDSLTQRLDSIKKNVAVEINVAELKGKLQTIRSQLENKQPAPPKPIIPSSIENNSSDLNQAQKDLVKQAEVSGERCFVVDLKFAGDCCFKTVRAGMVLDKIAEIAKIVKTNPRNQDLDEAKLASGFKITVASKSDEKALEQCAKQVLEIEQVNVQPLYGLTWTTESSTATKEAPSPEIKEPGKDYVITIEDKKVKIVAAETQSLQTVRVKFDQLDKLMNWVGELVINKIALLQITSDIHNDALKRITENIDRLTADLQDLVMEVRMVPVGQVFDRFPRLVRDLSLRKSKKIELLMDGREIEVDRTVLDEIGEPLIHLLRNSVDHGIELPEERAKAGKDATGKIKLTALRNGNQVVIEISDDGAGIDPEKIRESAIKKGFAAAAELDKMNREQLINLIFVPGFSTANAVSDTSGRGVGMDVVKTKISALGGTVHIDTQVGAGTKTTIKLPITLAIIQAILVKDTQTFAIPTSQVSEIVKVKKADVKSLGKTNAILVRDKVVPMIHLHQLLGLPDAGEDEFELLIVYLGDENTKVGIVVDSVLRQQDILVKTLSETFSGTKGISGATILGDGQVVLVLDVAQFVNRMFKKQAT